MKCIIPAKSNSERCINKNFREFIDGMSLVDWTIRKLLATGVVNVRDIYVSSDSVSELDKLQRRWGILTLHRDESLCDNSFPLTDWIRTIAAQVPDDDIAWCQVCDPLFDSYGDVFAKWDQIKESGKPIDSLVVCYPWRGYIMTGESQPVGWSFGEHHTPSQRLPEFRMMPFTLSVLTREAIERTGYHVGACPEWWVQDSPHIDIDTEDDFRLAQMMMVTNREKGEM